MKSAAEMWDICITVYKRSIIFKENKMTKKSVKVVKHKRSTPSKPAFSGSGDKPGPKTVFVPEYRRSLPKN